jgi:ArsR family transcriptional regulator
MTQLRKSPRTPRQAAACCSPLDDLLDPELFRALCDPTRVLLLACLAKCARPCSVSEIAECCSVDLSVVSRHLKMLEDAGVLSSTKVGRSVSYAVEFDELCSLLRGLADALDSCRCSPASCATGDCCAPKKRSK